ncbi:metal dependent phosphohydrolase [Thermovibrio ammonificans HB-1]|uniref:Ribonuclease Y n=1 Tax=Thermovibrio ammonificans (strain DSM 15698 / JCM 12110 / HB-1) TaxID=648996 RepID=E8T2W2_THEA1|nr:ribonuclease Y [Thermovibrio ammonificans]ADU97171.1 metal dependent phosphohydrolase [Thermovibrio ammonificans HB-1]
MESILVAIFAVLSGLAGGYVVGTKRGQKIKENLEREIVERAKEEANQIVERAKQEAQELKKKAEETVKEAQKRYDEMKKQALLEAKEELLKERERIEEELKEKRREVAELEKRLLRREEYLDKRESALDKREESLDKRAQFLDKLEAELEEKRSEVERLEAELLEKEVELSRLIDEEVKKLEEIAQMSREEAKEELMKRMEEEIRRDLAVKFKRIEEEFEQSAEKRAKKILATTIQRLASDIVAETTVTVVDLPNNEMKGRIIGREGRNIRAFELATGVDLIIDDTPEAVTISCFDPVRREIARIALERLVADGRIHPARIEEVVEKVQQEIEQEIINAAEEVLFELGIDNVHPELKKLLGRLKFRTSYGQNVLQHVKEVAYLAGMIAAEIGADVQLAKRAGLFHDIGKAVTHEVEGSHAIIGSEILKKYGEPEAVVNAAAAHHGEVEFTTIESVCAAAADALSAARPGARRESLEAYIKRIEKLESIAESFPGVMKAFAIQAGREIRIMVEPDKITDEEAAFLAHQISKKIEEEVQYPGQIKITVIRETRAVDYAK